MNGLSELNSPLPDRPPRSVPSRDDDVLGDAARAHDVVCDDGEAGRRSSASPRSSMSSRGSPGSARTGAPCGPGPGRSRARRRARCRGPEPAPARSLRACAFLPRARWASCRGRQRGRPRPGARLTISRISSSPLSVCWRSGKATLSKRFIEPNSAPSWNRTPNLLAHLEELVVGHVRDRLAVDEDVALVGVEQADHVLDADRLAGARRAEDHRDLALGQAHVQAAEDLVAAEGLVDVDELDGIRQPVGRLRPVCHWYSSSSSLARDRAR